MAAVTTAVILSESEVTQSCPTLRPHGLKLTRFLCPWDFSRQEYWIGLLFPSPASVFLLRLVRQ